MKHSDALRQLANDLASLKEQVLVVTADPGTPTLHVLTPLITRAHHVTRRALRVLTDLDSSWYSTVPGSLQGLEAMAAAVSAASLAGTDLATVLYHNPLDGTPPPGRRLDEDSMRRSRHTHAKPLMAQSLANAVEQLESASVACRYLAGGVQRAHTSLTESRQRQADAAPPTRLSTAQWTALRVIAQGGARITESLPRRTTHISTADGTRISQPTLAALEKHRLVRVDTSVPLHQGRAITLMGRGRQALYHHDGPSTTEAPAAQPPQPTTGKSR